MSHGAQKFAIFALFAIAAASFFRQSSSSEATQGGPTPTVKEEAEALLFSIPNKGGFAEENLPMEGADGTVTQTKIKVTLMDSFIASDHKPGRKGIAQVSRPGRPDEKFEVTVSGYHPAHQ